MKIRVLILLLFTVTPLFSQVTQQSYNLFQAKEWSKDISLFRSKAFLYNDVLGISTKVQKFSVIPLAASSSGELTTLLYQSDELDKEGMVLGFYGSFWNDEGVTYQGYGFKHLERKRVIAFLEKIDIAMEENKDFLKGDSDNNNIYFQFDDMQVLIYHDGGFKLRIFWNTFDSTWENLAYERTKRRFERRIK
ncbi:hypothetical protein [Arenibacter certesii]|uniref:DUF4252 domain-containing protein n=1 Tax=Arenibacter certesii TaxID=228955 RepID=A0A918IXR3_9FLAO|nr:hypothetical protein [Arenibacter certesii]GGW37300.1 hypothetical protein GCM10007383_22700 [Arenibacter certesii]